MTFQFKIQLKNVEEPAVWRTVMVPSHFSFLKFHEVIQAAFGWEGEHLFQFSPAEFSKDSDFEISIPDGDDWDSGEIQDAAKVKLSRIFTREGQKLLYIYDLGDNWEHEITLEKIRPEESMEPDCLAGKGVCPPEDCGGAWGYKEMKEILSDPEHPEYEEKIQWAELEDGQEWDPAAFNLDKAQKRVKAV